VARIRSSRFSLFLRGIFREFRTKSSGSRYAATDVLTGNRFYTLESVAGSVEEDKRDQSETKEEERGREEGGGGGGESVQ
jgi:hypothetical protein